MSATQKFFRRLFGQTGTRTAVPDLTQGDGTVSYEVGYGADYQRATGDPLIKNIERDKFNQVLYDVTLGLQQYQLHGFPEFVPAADNGGTAVSYAKYAFVLWSDGNLYFSLVANNTADPSDRTKWQKWAPPSDVGAVDFMTTNVAPAGYIKANGALLSRAAFPDLWAFAQASGNISASDALWQIGNYSPGDGSTTFRVPDLRGYHLRALDDGRGIDSGRSMGSAQADQNASHTHTVNDPTHGHPLTDPGHGHGVTDFGHAHSTVIGYSNENGTGNPWGSGGGAAEGNFTFTTASQTTGIGIGASGTGVGVSASGTGITLAASGGAETRVKTIALLACIKYQ